MRSCACLQDPQVNLYQKSKGGAKWISQDWPLFRAPALRRRRLPAGTPPPRVANSSLPAASSHPCHMTRSPSLLPPSPPPSKAPPALRPPSYLIDAATNATSSILCRCRGEAPSPRSPPAPVKGMDVLAPAEGLRPSTAQITQFVHGIRNLLFARVGVYRRFVNGTASATRAPCGQSA